jgi:hypothetical protein
VNITGTQLAMQYEVAIGRWPFLHDVERDYGLPPFLLAAVGSRETNLDPRYVDEPGDGGHGHGIWQRDNRSWSIPDPYPVTQQAVDAAAFLAALIDEEDDLIAALNRYNSGSPRTERTTGGDYGPDVMARREWLAAHYPVPSTRARARTQEVPMFIGFNQGGVGLFWDGEKVSYISAPDKDVLLKTTDGQPGVPLFGVLSDDFWRARGAPDEVIALTKP